MVQNPMKEAQARKIREWVESGHARELRENAGLTFADAGARCEVDPAAVWRWEHGDTNPRGRNVRVYYRFLADLEILAGNTVDARPAEPAQV